MFFGLFKKKKKAVERPSPAATPKKKYDEYIFPVVGIQYRYDNFMKFASENPDYDYTKKEIDEYIGEEERVYQYDFVLGKITLEEEPENPDDPKAIKVLSDGIHIGYIKRGSTGRVRTLMKRGIHNIVDTEAWGGKYKILIDDQVEKAEALPGAKICIFVEPQETE